MLFGLVSRADVVRAFVRSDEQLVEAIREGVLYRTLWLAAETCNVSVSDGRPRIAGQVERRSEAEMIERISAMVPGVTRVATELTWKLDDRQIEAPERDLVSHYKP